MTDLPAPARPPLLTVAEYAALGETERGYTELQDGLLLWSAIPDLKHQRTVGRLGYQLHTQVSAPSQVMHGLDVDLEARPPDRPGSVRRPDLIVLRGVPASPDGVVGASEVLIVIEVLAPESAQTDRVTKHAEYARAGIPHYWLVSPERRSLVPCRLTGEFGYRNGPEVTGTFTTTVPFPITLDLDALG